MWVACEGLFVEFEKYEFIFQTERTHFVSHFLADSHMVFMVRGQRGIPTQDVRLQNANFHHGS
jgi:hypothetical protein